MRGYARVQAQGTGVAGVGGSWRGMYGVLAGLALAWRYVVRLGMGCSFMHAAAEAEAGGEVVGGEYLYISRAR